MNLDMLIHVIDSIDPSVRKRKVSNEVVLERVIHLLRTGVSWRALQVDGCSTWSIYKRFRKWVKFDAFGTAWARVVQHYADERLAINPHSFKALFGDTTMIKNISGEDCTGRNPSDRGRLATKMSAICDDNMVMLSCQFYPANKNDSKTTLDAVSGIACKIKPDGRFCNVLVADKGYICRAVADELAKQRVRLLTPFKKNSRVKKRITSRDRSLLSKRHCIENLFCRLDKFRRIHFRTDRHITTFRAFTLLAAILLTQDATQKLRGARNNRTAVRLIP